MADIRITHADCRDLLPLIETNSIDMVLTDPPYFLDGLDNQWKKGRNIQPSPQSTVGKLPAGMKFDPKQGIQLQAFMSEIAFHIRRVLKPGGFALFFSQPRLAHRMAMGLEYAEFEIRDTIAWHFTKKAQYKAFSMNNFIAKSKIPDATKEALEVQCRGKKTPQLRPQHETIIVAQNPREGTFLHNYLAYHTGLINGEYRADGRVPSNLIHIEKDKTADYNTHPTVKPLALIEQLVHIFSEENQVILDPFLGSGTTAVAAAKLDRVCLGFEVNVEYHKIAMRRLSEVLNAE